MDRYIAMDVLPCNRQLRALYATQVLPSNTCAMYMIRRLPHIEYKICGETEGLHSQVMYSFLGGWISTRIYTMVYDEGTHPRVETRPTSEL